LQAKALIEDVLTSKSEFPVKACESKTIQHTGFQNAKLSSSESNGEFLFCRMGSFPANNEQIPNEFAGTTIINIRGRDDMLACSRQC